VTTAPSAQTVRLFATIKSLMKQRGLKYRDLADHLGLALPTVKKFMADGTIDLERLVRVAELLGTTLADLTAMARQAGDAVLTFTPAQEEFFAEHMAFFCFFSELNAGKTPRQIADEHGLTAASVRRYLKELERIGLIERHAGDAVRLLKRGEFTVWDDFGPMGRTYARYYVKAMADRALKSLDAPGALALWTGSRGLTPGQYAAFKEELDELVERYRAVTVGNRAAQVRGDSVQFLFVVDQWKDPYFDAIPNLP
jgi:transcriptional regulator with XRE-family HTH domain